MQDERFARSLIYVCAHSSEGAMGIVVNQPAPHISFPDLLVKLDVIPAADKIQLPPRAGDVKVLKGGPVETERGFVLHSADFFIENSTLPIDEGICLTATLDILKAIARGNGPASAILALGYAGWAPGQLENEMQQNGWLHCSADPDLIFGNDIERKIQPGDAEDRHPARHAVQRSRPRLTRCCSSRAAVCARGCAAAATPVQAPPRLNVDCRRRRARRHRRHDRRLFAADRASSSTSPSARPGSCATPSRRASRRTWSSCRRR